MFCGCEPYDTVCVSVCHVTMWCCMGDYCLCGVFSDFLVDSIVKVYTVNFFLFCVCDFVCAVWCALVPWGPAGVRV